MSKIVENLFNDVLSKLPQPHNQNNDETFLISADFENNSILSTFELWQNQKHFFDKVAGERVIIEPNPNDLNIIEGNIRFKGFESVAFYKSKRHQDKKPFIGKWGIFIIKDALNYMSHKINEYYPGYSSPDKLAYEFIYAHEIFHFYSDLTTLFLESVQNKHLYLPLRYAISDPTNFVEEALANQNAYNWAKKTSNGIEEFAYDFMSVQPNSYARFDESFDVLADEWICNTLYTDLTYGKTDNNITPWVNVIPANFKKKSACPVYIVNVKNSNDWFDSALLIPDVKNINVEEILDKLQKNNNLKTKWDNTKKKLIAMPTLRGLNFKPWTKEGPDVWSVKVDKGFRAHLRNVKKGEWFAYKIGAHTEMGHG
jgi:hypothetical protein